MVVHRDSQYRKKPRISVSFSDDAFAELQRIAEANDVSIAWVVRRAVDQYLHDQAPLLHKKPTES